MENNLYYPPTIEEFYVGFEYEIKIKDNWRKKSTTISDFSPISDYDGMSILEEDLISNIIRVKTLDQSDIESLGWKLYSQELTNRSNWCCFRNIQLELYVQLDNNYFPRLLNFKSRGGDHTGNFKIKIKNKSELIKLQQQLNIK